MGRRRNRWFVVSAIAAIAAIWTMQRLSEADRAVSGWGSTRTVLVATTDLEPGDVLDGATIERADRPQTLLPDDAIDAHVDDVIGRTVTASISRGEILVRRRLADAGDSGSIALLGADDVAFAVPLDHSTPELRVGDHVDVFAPGPPAAAKPASTGATRIAHGAVVVSIDDHSVMIGVDSAQAAAVARALLDAAVVMAVSR